MNKISCKLIVTLLVLLSLILIDCDDPTSPQSNDKNKYAITINSPNSVIKGGEIKLTAVVTGSENAAGGVLWNILGHSNEEETRIEPDWSNSNDAFLTVAREEPASTITVYATLNSDKSISVSKDISLLPNTPGVGAVTISPKADVKVIKGSEQQFTAIVEAVNGASDEVRWTLDTGKTSNYTNISSGGLLYVSDDERAATLTVRARSAFNNNRADSVTVKVEESTLPQLPKPSAPSLSSTGVAAWTYSNASLSEFRLQLYKDDAAYGSSIRVPSASSSYDFLSSMREAPGEYKVTVTALVSAGNASFANSPRSDLSGGRTVKALENPVAPSWNAASARWPRVADASSYTVELFKAGNDTPIISRSVAQIAAATPTPNVTQSFSTELTANKSGSYIFTVKANPPENNRLLLPSETVTVTAPYVYLTFAAGTRPFGSTSTSRVYDIAVNTAGNIFVAVGENGRIGRSVNGTTWTSIEGNNNPALNFSSPNDIRSVAWGNGRFVAVGSLGRIIYSTDGNKWDRTEDIPKDYTDAVPAEKLLYSIIWTGEYFVASGINSTYNKNKGTQVLRSSDGLKWERTFNDRTPTANSDGDGKTIFGFAHNERNVLAVGARGTATYSAGFNGSWGRVHDSILGEVNGSKVDAFGAVFGNNTWVVAGGDGRIAYTSGTTVTTASKWENRFAPSTRFDNYDDKGKQIEGDDVRGVVFANGMFVAVSDSGRISTSADGHNWYAITRGTGAGQTRFGSGERINSIKAFEQNGEIKFILAGFDKKTGTAGTSKIVISE